MDYGLSSDALGRVSEGLEPRDICNLRLTSKGLAQAVVGSDTLWQHQLSVRHPHWVDARGVWDRQAGRGSWWDRYRDAREVCYQLRSSFPFTITWELTSLDVPTPAAAAPQAQWPQALPQELGGVQGNLMMQGAIATPASRPASVHKLLLLQQRSSAGTPPAQTLMTALQGHRIRWFTAERSSYLSSHPHLGHTGDCRAVLYSWSHPLFHHRRLLFLPVLLCDQK